MDIIAWLDESLGSIFSLLYNYLIDLIQSIIDLIPNFIFNVIIGDGANNKGLFPDPSQSGNQALQVPVVDGVESSIISFFLNCLNWIFPVNFMLTLVLYLTLGIFFYFLLAPLLRWFKILT